MMQCSQCQSPNSPLDVHCRQCGHLLDIDLSASTSARPFSPYQLLDKAGEGGMGVVYRAYDASLCRFVAIKVLRAATAAVGQQQAQLEEARLLSSLQHPNIVTVYDISRYGEQQYIVTEWLEGQTLEQLLAAGKPELELLLDIAIQMAQGIDCAHQAGVIHRDLKPSNVMLLSKSQQIKLLDFGMASRYSESPGADDAAVELQTPGTGWSQQTTQGALKGTLPYLAPELTDVNARANVQSDIFSFGVMLYQLSFGVHPFLQASAAQTLQAIKQHRRLQLPSSSLPPALLKIIRQCLASAPLDRPASMQQVVQTLQQLQRELKQRARLGWLYPLTRTLVWLPLLLLTMAGSLYLGKFSVDRDDVLTAGGSLAILPFENIGADPVAENFIRGLAVSLNHDLSVLGSFNQNFWLVPVSEINQLENPSVSNVRQNFGTDWVLQGTVQHLGSSRRLQLMLVSAAHQKVVASRELDLPVNDWQHAQSRIRDTVVAMLQWQIPEAEVSKLSLGQASDDQAYSHYLTGISLLYRLDFKDNILKSIQELQAAVQLNPQFRRAKLELNNAYLMQARYQDYQQGFDLAQQASAELALQYPEDPEVLLQQAEILQFKSQHQQALQLYLQLAQKLPDQPKVWDGMAVSYEHLNQPTEAEQAYLRALKVQGSWFGWNQMATFYYRTRQLDKALDAYLELREITPNNDQVLQTLGAIQFAKGDTPAALQTFEQAVALNPSGFNYSNVATVLFYQKKYPQAVSYFELAVELQPKHLLVWSNLADSYRWAGMTDKARDSYQQALLLLDARLKDAPNSAKLKLRRALYLAKSGQIEQAQLLLDDISTMLDNQMRVMAAQVAEICGRRQQALDLLRQAVASGYQSSEIAHEPEFGHLWPEFVGSGPQSGSGLQ